LTIGSRSYNKQLFWRRNRTSRNEFSWWHKSTETLLDEAHSSWGRLLYWNIK